MTNKTNLRDKILEKYDSEAALARDLGWPRQKLNRFTNGDRVPDLSDAKQLAEKLDMPIDIVVKIFLPNE